jgi:hypothetical protein
MPGTIPVKNLIGLPSAHVERVAQRETNYVCAVTELGRICWKVHKVGGCRLADCPGPEVEKEILKTRAPAAADRTLYAASGGIPDPGAVHRCGSEGAFIGSNERLRHSVFDIAVGQSARGIKEPVRLHKSKPAPEGPEPTLFDVNRRVVSRDRPERVACRGMRMEQVESPILRSLPDVHVGLKTLDPYAALPIVTGL